MAVCALALYPNKLVAVILLQVCLDINNVGQRNQEFGFYVALIWKINEKPTKVYKQFKSFRRGYKIAVLVQSLNTRRYLGAFDNLLCDDINFNFITADSRFIWVLNTY